MTLDIVKAIAGLSPESVQIHSEQYEKISEQLNGLYRDLVMDEYRIDVLVEMILGFKPEPHHIQMMEWQTTYQEGLLLGWRGAAKTTFCTVARCLFEILHNPDIRILIVSDATDQAKIMLRQIKSHLKSNEKFISVFGDWTTGASLWSETEITVNRRKAHHGEPTVMVAGIGTALPSRHFDLIIADDLVTEDNSQTEGQRQKVHDYFYKTLFPTLESPYGRLYAIGTRWNEEDLYGWLEKEDYAHATLRIGVLDEDTDLSRWEEKFPTERMHRIRKANLAAFELQYMCRSGVGLGNIFSQEHFVYYDGDIPADMFKWQGVDLAIGQKSSNDFFVHSTLCIHRPTKDPYLVECRKTRLTFPKQVSFISARYKEHPDTVRVVVERNAYQDALRQMVRSEFPDVPVLGKWTQKDKITRAQKLAFFFTDHPLRVRREHSSVIRLLCGFPKLKGSKDVFDSIDLAITQGLKGAKRRRKSEPGLI